MFSFQRALPEEVGIPSESIEKILLTLQEKKIPLHSLLVMKSDKLIYENYFAPYEKDTLHRMYSISKSYTGVAILLLAARNRISLDDHITDYFPEYTDAHTNPRIKETTIRNMLMMRTPHTSSTYKNDLEADWVGSFFTTTPTQEPGTLFHYETCSSHVLGALVEKLTGKELLQFLKDELLFQLDYSKDSYMIKDPFNVSMGGTGLMSTPMDILKMLYLLYKKGTVVCTDGQERSLLPKELVDEATSNLTDTESVSHFLQQFKGYGLLIWINDMDGFVLYGMNGQMAIAQPSRDLLVVTTADTEGIPNGEQIIYDAISENLF